MQAPPLPPALDFPRIKILAVGNCGVGKSCLIKHYCEGRFVAKYIPTIGIDYGVKKVEVKPSRIAQHRQKLIDEGHTGSSSSSSNLTATIDGQAAVSAVRVNFWDVAGGEDSFHIRNEFYAAAQGILLVYDVRDAESFAALDDWLDEMAAYTSLKGSSSSNAEGEGGTGRRNTGVGADRRASQPATTTTSKTPAGRAVGDLPNDSEPILYLIANKVDDVALAEKKRAVSEAEGRRWAQQHHCAAYYETTATTTGGRDITTEAMENLFYDVLAKFA